MAMLNMGLYNGAALTHIDIDELVEGLIVGLTLDVSSVVAFGNPLTSLALIVKKSV